MCLPKHFSEFPDKIFGDNQATSKLVQPEKYKSGRKYIDAKYNFMSDLKAKIIINVIKNNINDD